MGSAAPKKRPMRSKRSGVKKFKQYMANWEILKKLGAFLLVLFIVSCVPVRYVYVDPKDSVIREQRIIHSNIYIQTPLFLNRFVTRPYVPQRRVIMPVRPPAHKPAPRGVYWKQH